MPAESYWDGIASRYTALYENGWSRFEDLALRRDLERFIAKAPGHRILDVGCGAGLGYELLGGELIRKGYMGLDISAGMLREFNKRHPLARTILGSGDDLASIFRDAEFDFVMAINVSASFLNDLPSFLRCVHRQLDSGGLIYLSFLNRFSLRRLLKFKTDPVEMYRSRGDTISRESPFAQTYVSNYLTSICRQSGFVGVETRYYSVLGGVWESAAAIPLERCLSKIAPCLGHSIVVTAVRH